METLYEDKDIWVDYKVIAEHVDSYDQPNQACSTKMIY